MKRFIILFVLLVFVASFAIAQEFTNKVEFLRYHINPTTLSSQVSIYDYMNAGYNGFPIRIHGDNIQDGGIYFTFMMQPQGLERKQYFAWVGLNTQESMIEAQRLNDRQGQHREGFGSVGIDPITGNAIFAWHSVPITHEPNQQDVLNTYFDWDDFRVGIGGGHILQNVSEFVSDNISRDPSLKHEFIWPNVYIGPSPIANKSRVYIFMKSSAGSHQVNPRFTGGFTESSSTLIAIADLGWDDWDKEIVWTERYIDYLEAMHWWNPIDHGHEEGTSARAFLAYGVAPAGPYAGYVALAGQVEGEYWTWSDWTDIGPHNHIVLLSDDFGETFVPHGFLIEQREEPGWVPQLDPEWLAILPADERTFLLNGYNSWVADTDQWTFEPITMNNKTVIFDEHGSVHFPSLYRMVVSSDGGWWPESITAQIFAFNVHTKVVTVTHLDPQLPIDMPHSIPWSFDLDDDGYIDWNYYPDGTTPMRFPFFIPQFYQDTRAEGNVWFIYNQMRMTESNRGRMAIMWLDSTKAHFHDIDSDWYPEYRDTPEIMISFTGDHGKTWSDPFRMHYNEPIGSQLSVSPSNRYSSFVYPADRLIVVDRTTVRLYFMYNDDLSYGSGDPHNHGLRNGTAMRYTAMDFDISGLHRDDDSTAPIAQSMLSQNFPNPFNPSTTISFNNPVAGNVKLNVYNVRGQFVKTLVDTNMTSGQHSVEWNGMDSNNRSVASGIYFYRLEANGLTETRRMVLMK
ncbi:MAG: T9SS type A sorting domain-containing protein [Candidatus Cloacimonetes bacterium]|nr:T9SS type A sorting domain-containing protein [Candidatus Cloacimonadota bacterium]